VSRVGGRVAETARTIFSSTLITRPSPTFDTRHSPLLRESQRNLHCRNETLGLTFRITANRKADLVARCVDGTARRGFGKSFRLGSEPAARTRSYGEAAKQCADGAYGNVVKPEFGPEWQLCFQVQFVFPM